MISAAAAAAAHGSGAPLLPPLVTPPKGAAAAPSPTPRDPQAPAPELEAGADGNPVAAGANSSSSNVATSSSGASASMPPPPHAYRYPAHGAYPQPYYSPYPYCGPAASVGPVAPVGPQYQDCYPSYYHRAMHYRRHYSYLAPHAGPQDPYATGASALAVPPPAGAVHQMQMVVSSGPPPVPGPPPSHPPPPLDYPVEPYVHYPTYPGPETATFRCPCPMQSCPKNVHTGPLTGDSKGPKQMQPLALPLPPVALALPQEPPTLPPGILGPPSPARGSAGMPPPPSPAVGATHAPTQYQTWDNMEGSKSVVKQDPGTPPEAPAEPPALVLATRHNLCRQNVPPPANPPASCVPAHLTPRRKRAASPGRPLADLGDAVKVEDAKDAKELMVAKAAQNGLKDLKDIKDVKSVSVLSFTTTITTTTIEESTQTTPPPEARAPGPAPPQSSCQPADKRPGGQEADAPPSKKNKKLQRKQLARMSVWPSKSKSKKMIEMPLSEGLRPGHGLTTTVAALTTATTPPKPKTTSSKNNRKTTSTTSSTTVTTAVASTSSTSPVTAPSSTKKAAGGKKGSAKRTSSVDSNKSTGSSGGGKRSKSRDKNQDAADDKSQDKADSKPQSRDNSAGRSRSESRSRLVEEEQAAAAVIAAAGLPEGVPLNQCRRLIAAQKKLISKCQAKKEREQARLARQEAARAARLAALVSAAEAKKAASLRDSRRRPPPPPPTPRPATPLDAAGAAVAARLSPAAAPAPAHAPAQHHGKHHHNNNNLMDPAVDRGRVEELGRLAGLEVPASLTVSQSELRLLECCAEPKTPKWSNGWQWRGQPFLHRVFLNCDDPPVLRKCYPAMQHDEGDNITLGDTILLKSGTRKIDLPFVARVIHLWENPEDGEMMLSLVWFYRPEHTEQGRRPCDRDDEIFSSRHKDFNSVACIEDKCYVLTFNEYCRYRKTIRRLEEGLSPPSLVVPGPEGKYPRHHRLPPGHVAPDMVFFCRRIYDFRQRRLQKNIC
ncbi:hypothetical protein FOCC_FOCC002970 [Frankliniella occidentalis]|nr:hypothetical protein FOCC_FOCC002970 [Frankliniella occidentalis]